MSKMKDNLLKLLEDTQLTVNEIMNKLELDDDLIVISMITELEIEMKIELTSFKTCYEPDGCAFYLARYGLVKPHGVSVI